MALQFKSATGFDYVSAATPLPVTIVGGGTGDVDGPASATDNAIARFDGTTGKLIQNSTATLSDNGDIAIPSTATAGLQLYNTADQVTNVGRTVLRNASTVGYLGSETVGTATGLPLVLFAQDSNASANFVRLAIQRTALPFYQVSLTSNVTGTQASTTSAGTFFGLGSATSAATSGSVIFSALTPTYNQASGTAANTDLLINRTETAVGSGAQYLIQAQVGGSDRFLVTNAGRASFAISGSGGVNIGDNATPSEKRLRIAGNSSAAAWGVNGPIIGVIAATWTDSTTAASGTAASAVFSSFAQPTLAATNASVATTDAATVYIAAAPANGTNNTITNPYALWVDAGTTRLDGNLSLRAAYIGSTQALSGPGAANVTTETTKVTSTGVDDAISLADGVDGQVKRIIHDVDGGSFILTPTTKTGWSTFTSTAAGESISLQFVTTRGWIVIGSYLGTIAA